MGESWATKTWHRNPLIRGAYLATMAVSGLGVRLAQRSECPRHIQFDWPNHPPRRNLARAKVIAHRTWAPIGKQIGHAIALAARTTMTLIGQHRRLS